MSLLIFGVVCLFLVGGSDGCQEGSNNGTGTCMRQVTYHVNHLYQGCPPTGRVMCKYTKPPEYVDVIRRTS